MEYKEKSTPIQVPSFLVENKLAIVIGASQGIGRTISICLAKAGAEVILCSRREKVLMNVVEEIDKNGGKSSILPLDVRDVDSIQQFASQIQERIRIRNTSLILINSAGVDLTKPVLDVSESDWDLIHNTHLKGLFFICQAIGRLMIEQGYGKIINISSTWSFSTDPGKSVYAAAKAGVSHLTSALATEWGAYGVRVNAIAPTATLTPPTVLSLNANKDRAERLLAHIPMGRFATPDDLVGTVLFLASEASDFINGQTIFVDGGWRAKG